MEPIKFCIKFFVLAILYSATTFFTLTDARHVVQFSNFQGPKFSSNSINKPKLLASHVDIHKEFVLSRAESNGLGTPFPFPFPLPPIGSIPPLSPPLNNIPAPPSVPNLPFQSPPHAASSPPAISPGLSPPSVSPGLSPPSSGIRSPPKSIPSPPAAHPPHKKPQYAIWCVAKPAVPDTIIQEAMDYACGSGADCKAIQPNGLCFQPNTLFAHASYAFNSYWQKTKVGGGTCDFGGTAMLVTTDPSFDDCRFIYN